MKITRLASCVVAAALLATLPHLASAADPYTIYVIAPITGPSAFLGNEEASALKVLEDQVNKTGGVRGRPIHFVIQDDQTLSQNSVQLLNGIITQKVPFLLGTSQTAACGAMLPVVANGPVVYCFSPGVHPPPGSYMFSASISTADYIVATIRYLRSTTC